MRRSVIAAHNLTIGTDGELASAVSDKAPFSVETYSRMKFGDRMATQELADQLTPVLVEQVPGFTQEAKPPLFAVAYKAVPPACFFLSANCLAAINEVRVNSGLEPGRIVHVYKNKVTATNYADSSHSSRQAELAGIDFSFEGRDISAQTVAVLDDVRITGSAEERMATLIEEQSPSSLILGYIALLDPEQAKQYPSIENEMNTAEVRGIFDVATIISDGAFDLNIRTLKLILGSEREDIESLLQQVDPSIALELYRGAIATGPDFIAQYSDGFTCVEAFARKLKTQQ